MRPGSYSALFVAHAAVGIFALDLRASYDLELKADHTAHGGYVRASMPF